METKQWHS